MRGWSGGEIKAGAKRSAGGRVKLKTKGGDTAIRFKPDEDHSARPAPLENGTKSIKSPKIDLLLHNCLVLTL